MYIKVCSSGWLQSFFNINFSTDAIVVRMVVAMAMVRGGGDNGGRIFLLQQSGRKQLMVVRAMAAMTLKKGGRGGNGGWEIVGVNTKPFQSH